MAGLFTELKRRNVFRVAAAYAAVAWLTLELLSIVLPTFGAPDWMLRAVIAVLALGFVPALVFAWVFELTDSGLKRETEIDRNAPGDTRTARKLDVAVIVVVVAAVAVLVADRAMFDERGSATRTTLTNERIDSIAVLPFEDFSAGGNNAHLGTGIADTILHSLTQLPGLKVAARTSSFLLAEQDADIATIGESLGVGAVLEGSVQVAGNQLRIIAQLVRTSDQSHLWSKTFDGTTDDIFATQDTIAAEVAKSLRGDAAPALAPQQRTDPEVFALVAKGRDLWQLRNPRDLNEAVALLERAVEIDPEYAPAHTELAAAIWFSTLYGALDRDEARVRAEAEIARTLQLDPGDAQAWAIRGLILSQQFDRAATIQAYERALELNPNDANTMVWLSQELTAAGLHNESRELVERAFRLDPMNMYVRGRYAVALAQTGQPDSNRRALEIVDESLRLAPLNSRVLDDAGAVAMVAGDLVEAVQYSLDALRVRAGSFYARDNFLTLFAMLDKPEYVRAWGAAIDTQLAPHLRKRWALLAGDFELFADAIERAVAHDSSLLVSPTDYGLALALTGRYDDAIAHLENALAHTKATRYRGHPTVAELIQIELLAWLYAQKGEPARVAELQSQMPELFQQLQRNGRPPGIDGMLMETGFHISMGDLDAATEALRARSHTNERLLFAVWRDFPWMAEFVQRADVQQLFAEWEAEQRAIFQRLQDSNPPPALFDPSRLDEL